MAEPKNIKTIVDHIGRTVVGVLKTEDKQTLTLENPVYSRTTRSKHRTTSSSIFHELFRAESRKISIFPNIWQLNLISDKK